MAYPKCTDQAIETAIDLKKRGALDKDIAAAIGVHADTFCRWKNRPKTENQRRLGRELEKVEAEYKASLLTIIYNAGVNGQWQAAAWILERKYPEEYSRRERSVVEAKVEAAPAFYFDPSEIDG